MLLFLVGEWGGWVRIRYGDVEAVIRAIHGAGSKPTALLGRFKYLQRLDWPPNAVRGQGNKAGYGLSHLIGFVLAFELLELGLPPLRVVRLLRTSWDVALGTVLLGWAALVAGRPVFLALFPGALAELGMAEDEHRPTPDRLVALGETDLLEWMRIDPASGATAMYMVDARRLALAVSNGLVARLLNDADIGAAFRELGAELFGTAEPLGWARGRIPR